MGRCRFVEPSTVRIALSEGDWIEVKKRLNVGEERSAFQAIVGEVNMQGWRKPNVDMIGVAEMFAYIVDWSFRDGGDRPVPVTVGAIKSLDLETYEELEKALDKHKKAMEEEREALSKKTSGEIVSAATSPSVV